MEIIFFLIPIALLLVTGIIAGLFWAVKSGQFDDMEGPAYQIIMDEEIYPEKTANPKEPGKEKETGRNSTDKI